MSHIIEKNSSQIHIKRNLDTAKEFHWQYRTESSYLKWLFSHMLFIDPLIYKELACHVRKNA